MLETIWEVAKELCGIGYAKIAGFLRAAWGKLLACIPAVARKKGEAAIIEAEAAAEVKKTEARGIIEVNEMLRRQGLLAEWQQGNINNIVRLADGMMPLGDAEKFRNMNKDWVADCLDKCKNDSDEEMQSLWAKILVGEADKPGSFSKSTVDAVSKMSKKDALLFTDFCQFVWFNEQEGNTLLVYDFFDEIYLDSDLFFEMTQQLAHLRLVSQSDPAGYSSMFFTPSVVWAYHGDSVYLNLPSGSSGLLSQAKRFKGKHLMHVGHVLFTEAGEQLYCICGAQKNDAFFQYVLEKWKDLGYNPVVQKKGAEE